MKGKIYITYGSLAFYIKCNMLPYSLDPYCKDFYFDNIDKIYLNDEEITEAIINKDIDAVIEISSISNNYNEINDLNELFIDEENVFYYFVDRIKDNENFIEI